MGDIYSETVSLCPVCAKDSHAFYEEQKDGMYLHVGCNAHGPSIEKVESDSNFFKQGYELEYKKPYEHLALPITYRCNLKCNYCYTLSNSSFSLPKDRTIEKITEILEQFDGNVTLIGGEPTMRKDLFKIIRIAKEVHPDRKVSLGTNGTMLNNIEFVKGLKNSALDFVFLSFNDIEYERSPVIYQDKVTALNNCQKLQIPVWLQRTIENLGQLDSILEPLETYKKVIFSVTLRVVKPFGIYYPDTPVFVSDMLKYLRKGSDYTKGGSPFNRYIRLKGKNVKVCSWVNDMKRLDPIDSSYIISNDTLTTFHRGMKMDEMLLKRGANLFK